MNRFEELFPDYKIVYTFNLMTGKYDIKAKRNDGRKVETEEVELAGTMDETNKAIKEAARRCVERLAVSDK